MTKRATGLAVTDLISITAIDLPEILLSFKTAKLHKSLLVRACGIHQAEVIDNEERDGQVLYLKLRVDGSEILTISSHQRTVLQGEGCVVADQWTIADGILHPSGMSYWHEIPQTIPQISNAHRRQIIASWKKAFLLSTNLVEDDGSGLRKPQIGALHALAAHWSTKSSPGIVVLPTGTGKTDVMIAGLVIKAPRRLLVLLPSDALRTQLADKFVRFGVLRSTDSVTHSALSPIVGIIRRSLVEGDFHEFEDCNVVITTVTMLRNMQPSLLQAFLDQFSLVFVDEAHHVPAESWKKIFEAAQKKYLVGFTATPFREDGKRIPGSIIYNFPLRMAQELGYFTPIKFLDVSEPDNDKVAGRLAELGVSVLREDDANGFKHILLARTGTKAQAEKLFNDIYSRLYSEWNPIVLHSGVPGRTKIVERIRSGHHRIIVCVDMLGEGFDLPQLKIAVLHTVHKSLAITLQFAGRFTRSSSKLGPATIVANSADDRFPDAVEELYAEDADWNELLPDLSEQTIGREVAVRNFIQNMRQSELPDASLFDLLSLKPKMSAVMYKAPDFHPDRVDQAIPSGWHIHAKWVSDDRQLVICITRSSRPLDWADVKGATDEVWDLWIFAYSEARKVLFINSSLKSSLHGAIARRLTSGAAVAINGEEMFRAFAGISRLTLHNVGLYGKGKLRFKMFAGLDIADAVTAVHQANNAKSNLFATGYEDGSRTGIGVSFKGRAWAMESGTIPEWISWCERVLEKLLDKTIGTDSFLSNTLLPKQVSSLPNLEIIAVLSPDEWLPGADGSPTLIVDGGTQTISAGDVYVSQFARTGDTVTIDLSFDDSTLTKLALRWGPNEGQLAVTIQGVAPTLRFGDREVAWNDYLKENPFNLLFVDGSELRGTIYLAKNDPESINFDLAHAKGIDWGNTDLKIESKWKAGAKRTNSIQAFMIDRLLATDAQIIFDDDGANEAADIVALSVDDDVLSCTLYHCKYSSHAESGMRVKDVQEVCAQAIRSARWSDNPVSLLKHLRYREGEGRRGGRPTRLERGTLTDLKRLRSLAKRRRFKLRICVVQPGVSLSQLDPQSSSVFGAADNYIVEITGKPLTVYASE